MKYAWILATAAISGVSIFLNSLGIAEFDPFALTTVRNAVVALGLVSLLYLGGNARRLRSLGADEWKKLLAIGLFGGSLPFLLFFWGLAGSSAAAAGFIHKTMFVWVSVLAFAFLGERLTRLQLAGAATLLAGLFVFSGMPSLSLGWGELAILAATLLWSIETVISKKALSTVSPSIVAAARMGFGLFALAPFTLLSSGVPVFTATHYGWLALTSVLLFGYVFTWYHGLALAKASEATALLLLGSVITTAFSLSAKEVAPLQLAGIALMLAGMAAATGALGKVMEALRNVHSVPCESAVKE